MASVSKHALWKGAISFGLVHIPIALHSAIDEHGLDFDWLDKRSMDPVGYKRINKATGKEIDKENIVKGIEYEDGHYVVLSSEEMVAAYPKATQTVEIEAFVPIAEIPFIYLERPYYISPINKGAKVYALLREVLHKAQKVGVAKVVIQTKQHLAILMPCGPALILNLLRWDDEIRTWDELNLPAQGTDSTGLTKKEMTMGEQLVADMSTSWAPQNFTDSFKEQILQLVKEKVEAGKTELVAHPDEAETESAGAKIYDLTEMLQRSLNKGTRTLPKDVSASRSELGGSGAHKKPKPSKGTPVRSGSSAAKSGRTTAAKERTTPVTKTVTKKTTSASADKVKKRLAKPSAGASRKNQKSA